MKRWKRPARCSGFIAKLPSGIERDYYLKRTAEALDLDEGVLRQEMPKQAKQSSGTSSGQRNRFRLLHGVTGHGPRRS